MAELYRTLTGQSHSSQESRTRAPLNRITTTDPNTGALNHLTEDQLETLDVFKDRLEKDGWWSPEGINGKPTHDDGTLLRYLRARKFDVDGAIGQFTDTEKWMKEQRVEELYEHFDVEFYEKARTMYPQWTGHRDRRGIPLYVYVIKHLDSKNVSKYEKQSKDYKNSLPNHKNLATPAKMLPLFALYHNLLNFVLPMCSTLERPNPEIPVTNSTNIVDISHVGLTQFWNLKNHMQEASILATAHYPETLDRIFIIGAPSFFPTVWGWIKRWFDPVTVSKIFILGKHEVKRTLLEFFDAQDFPKQYGGELEWNFGDLPHMDAPSVAAIEKDGHKGWVKGPCMWLDHERVIVGSEHGKLRREDKDVAAKKPVVYAADFTEEPVHPDRRGSSLSRHRQSSAASSIHGNGIAHKTAVATGGGGAMAAALAEGRRTRPATPTNAPIPEVRDGELQTAPIDGSPLRLPHSQPGAPAKTAEYISQESLTAASSPAAPKAGPTDPIVAPTAINQAGPPEVIKPTPPFDHQVEMHKALALKMEGESLSTIPPNANGIAGFKNPELTTTSDNSKGLVLATEKLTLTNNLNGRSAFGERFYSAQES